MIATADFIALQRDVLAAIRRGSKVEAGQD
jgi:hypothetical protein